MHRIAGHTPAGDSIERRSFQIIRERPGSCPGPAGEEAIVVRVAHAIADIEFARSPHRSFRAHQADGIEETVSALVVGLMFDPLVHEEQRIRKTVGSRIANVDPRVATLVDWGKKSAAGGTRRKVIH